MTPAQRSAYRDLLDQAWLGDPPCSLPDDERILCGMSGLTQAEWEIASPIIRQWFELRGGRLVNGKQRAHFNEMMRRRRLAQTSGKEGGRKSAAMRGKRGKAPLRHPQATPVAEGVAESNLSVSSSSSVSGSPSENKRARFVRFWERVHRKVGKEQTWAEFEKLNPDDELTDRMIAANVEQQTWLSPHKPGEPYSMQDPVRWVKYRRWEDERPIAAAAPLKGMNGHRVYLSPTGKIWELERRKVQWLDQGAQRRGAREGYETIDGTVGICAGGTYYPSREAAEQAIRAKAPQRDEYDA